MLFAISKIVPALLMPLSLILALSAVLLILSIRTRKMANRPLRRGWLVFLWAAWGFLYLLSTPMVADVLVKAWEYPLGSLERLEGQTFDALLVLGGSIDPANSDPANLHYELGSSAERLTSAVLLYRQGLAGRVLFSGGSGNPWNQKQREAPLAANLLLGLGIPAQALLVEGNSRNTYENALYSAPLLAENRLDRVLLITSALHMRRSLAIFRKQGLAVEAWACDTLRLKEAAILALLPSSRALDTGSKVLREMLGYLAYAVLGRL